MTMDAALKKIQNVLGAGTTWFPISLVLGASLGLLFWLISFYENRFNLEKNLLADQDRTTVLICVVVSVLIFFGALIIGYIKYGK